MPVSKVQLAIYNLLFVAIAVSFYPLGRALIDYHTWSVRLGLGLVIMGFGLAILVGRFLRGVSQPSGFVGGVVRVITYSILILLGFYAGIVNLTLENWYTNPFIATFVIAIAVAISTFIDDSAEFATAFRRQSRQPS